MNNKLIISIVIIIIFAGILPVFITMANAEGLNLFCSQKQNIIVTLKNDAETDKAKAEISKIPQVRIVKITERDKEWSKMVNKMDLPNMENPFKNEFIIKSCKNAETDDIINKLKEKDYVENVECISDEEYKRKLK